MAHFDTALEQQLALAARARIAFHHVAQVGNLVRGDVAIPVGTGQVETGLVGAANKIAQMGGAAIDDDATGKADRADGACVATGGSLDLLVIGEGQWVSHARKLLGLDFVQLVVATQYQGDDGLFAVLVFLGQYQQGLGDGGRRHVQESGHFIDGVDGRGGHLGQGFGCGSALASRCQGFGHLDVGGVIGCIGEGDQVFTALGQHLEFVGAGAPMEPVSACTGRKFRPMRVKAVQ